MTETVENGLKKIGVTVSKPILALIAILRFARNRDARIATMDRGTVLHNTGDTSVHRLHGIKKKLAETRDKSPSLFSFSLTKVLKYHNRNGYYKKKKKELMLLVVVYCYCGGCLRRVSRSVSSLICYCVNASYAIT
jgi:hypothetical protein